MFLKNFRSYSMAVDLYQRAKPVMLPHGLRDQLMRAVSSVALNLQEGSAKPSPKERRRFYLISLASVLSEQG
jgi:four helix bundle protein